MVVDRKTSGAARARTNVRPIFLFGVVVVPACYCFSGMFCLWYVFGWGGTVLMGVLHVGSVFALELVGEKEYGTLLNYVAFVLAGVVIFLVVWTVLLAWWAGWDLDRCELPPFALGLIGSVCWSLAAWQCTAQWRYARASKVALARAPTHIHKWDWLLVLTAPTAITAVLGVIHAVTDPSALVLGERVADFFHVVIIGVALGLLLAPPWLFLRFGRKGWRRDDDGSGTSGPAI